MSESILHAKGLTKSFGDKKVLDDLFLEIEQGSVVGLLGRNGSGKSTLLKCALGLLRPSAGAVSVMGENAWDLSAEVKGRLGYVPQEVVTYPWMTVGQVIKYTAAFYEHWNDDLVGRLVKQWDLDEGARSGTLSVGQTQALAIVLAMGHEPEVLILDEPVASLDPAARRDFMATLIDMVADGDRTVLFSTHITSDLERVADRVAVLKDGNIVYHDEIAVLKENVKRLRIHAGEDLPGSFRVKGALRCEVQGTEALVSVADYSDAMRDRLVNKWEVEIDVEDLNLEEIFLEMHHG